MPGPDITWMGDCRQVGKPSWYVSSHLGQLSLAIPLWVGTMCTSRNWVVNRHIMLLVLFFLLALDQGSYATDLGEASVPQVTECYFGFVEQKSDGIIFIEMVAVCIFQYQTFSR